MMESFDKFYRDFVRPPLAPIYYPSVEEFADPIAYVAKIRCEAEKYGVVKIVPPQNFKPPFAIDPDTFEFTPRIQKINEIEAIVRERSAFAERLDAFWMLQGTAFKNPVLEGRPLDTYKLYRVVNTLGGFDDVTQSKQWSSVAKKLGYKSSQAPSKLREFFLSYILPYLLAEETKLAEEDSFTDYISASSSDGDKVPTKSGRMMAGLAPRLSRMVGLKLPKKSSDPMEDVFCSVCNSGDDEDQLMLCENCDRSMHTGCCEPPLKEVPKGEWHCPSCVIGKLDSVVPQFGFYDNNSSFTITSFREYADDFKKNYFNVANPTDVTDDDVEREFWRNIIKTEPTVAVKYGADLITSKVGSGFPRKTDDLRGSDVKRKAQYANHAWNLNNLPVLRESVLSHIETGISGMMVPWVYVGMCFSTFCWHTEDHWTYSINYNHWGEPKVWYGISGEDAEKFEELVKELAPVLTTQQRDIFHHMATAVNPALLRSKGLDVWTVHQNAGEFVVTFPRAYHAGYNEGVNFAEAVNFAPIDWLKMGRRCVDDYSKVKRACVFNLDELVLKMVSSSEKLGIPMSLAVLDEMMQISHKEMKQRSIMAKSGVVLSAQENFENIADDHRTCRYCNTTVFLSALTCAHNNVVCLEHIMHICDKCPIGECVFKYRFTLEELVPMIEKLKGRTADYLDWAKQVDNLLSDKNNKPKLVVLDKLLDVVRTKKWPHTLLFQRALNISKSCHIVSDKVRVLLNGKVRTRKETRIQRADTRLDLSGIRTLLQEIEELPCNMDDVLSKVTDLVVRISKWQKGSEEIIEQLETTSYNDIKTDVLETLIREGDEFDVPLPQLDSLRKTLARKEWVDRVSEIIEWEQWDNMEDDDDFLTREREDIDCVLKIIKDGSDIMKDFDPDDIVHKLYLKHRSAVRCNNLADGLLKAGFIEEEKLLNFWSEARESDWCSGRGMEGIRYEISLLREAKQKSSDVLSHGDCLSEYSRYSKSIVLPSTSYFSQLSTSIEKMERSTKLLTDLFYKTNSYHDLVEIVRERDDLAALIEGERVPRKLRKAMGAKDEWKLLSEFSTEEELQSHLATLTEQQRILLSSLKSVNDTRSSQETCICAGSCSTGSDVICILCRGKFHDLCISWDPFLDRLPRGAYLCMSCLRGKRPQVVEIEAVYAQMSPTSLERVLVKHLCQRVSQCSGLIMNILKDPCTAADQWNESYVETLTIVLEAFLSLEAVDQTTFQLVIPLIQRHYKTTLEAQKDTCNVIRNRETTKPWPIIFDNSKRSRGKRSITSSEKKREKKKRTIYHEIDQLCSAGTCIKPYGEQVRWIQCGKCSNWYHYICVGQTVEGAKAIDMYMCILCK